MDEGTLWDIRAFIYQHFANTTRAPRVDETADTFALTHKEAASAYEALHARHAFFLKPGTHEILMANPFSNVETPFRAHAHGKTYFANCAWDSLGIPAMLDADATVEARDPLSEAPITYAVHDGQLVIDPGYFMHFPLPAARWYDDLVFT